MPAIKPIYILIVETKQNKGKNSISALHLQTDIKFQGNCLKNKMPKHINSLHFSSDFF